MDGPVVRRACDDCAIRGECDVVDGAWMLEDETMRVCVQVPDGNLAVVTSRGKPSPITRESDGVNGTGMVSIGTTCSRRDVPHANGLVLGGSGQQATVWRELNGQKHIPMANERAPGVV